MSNTGFGWDSMKVLSTSDAHRSFMPSSWNDDISTLKLYPMHAYSFRTLNVWMICTNAPCTFDKHRSIDPYACKTISCLRQYARYLSHLHHGISLALYSESLLSFGRFDLNGCFPSTHHSCTGLKSGDVHTIDNFWPWRRHLSGKQPWVKNSNSTLTLTLP